MTTPVQGPAVELTVRVRYPMPTLDADLADLGIHTVEDLVRNEVEAMRLDPSFLTELIDSDRSEVEFSFELDARGHEFEGGTVRGLSYGFLDPA